MSISERFVEFNIFWGKKMNIRKWGMVGILCVAFLYTSGAVERGRNQPTERISGRIDFVDPFNVSIRFISFCF